MNKPVSFTTMARRGLLASTVVLSFATFAGSAGSADLTIGLGEVNLSMDPHFTTSPATFNVNSQIYEQLFRWNEEGISQPWLAEKLERVNDTTWLLHLRKNVKFSDGSPFTAEDVIFSFKRGVNVPNAASSFKTYIRQIEKAEAVDETTVRITTSEPAPHLIEGLTYFLIVSKKHGEKAETADYNSGKAAIGTGPYKFVSWQNGIDTVLERNPGFWGKQPHWTKITYRSMPANPARVAALLTGEIHVAEHLPSEDLDRLRSNQNVKIWNKLTGRVTYFNMDVENALKSGKITGPNGEKLDKNPLADPKVRRAMREAIDVDAFVRRIYHGEGEPTAQYIPEGFEGYAADVKLEKSGGIDRAKKLLEEAGWHNKFKIELSTASGFFPKSVQATEAIAQSWTRAGIPTSVVTMPYPVYLQGRRERTLPISFSAYQNTTKTASFFYPTLLHSPNPEKGQGTLNLTRYTNAEVDRNIDIGMTSFDPEVRKQAFASATRAALNDDIFVPLFFLYAIHGSTKDIVVQMRADRGLRGDNVFPANAAPASAAR